MKHGRTLAERFWPKVNKTESCWLWTAYRDKDGYGTLNVSAKDGLSACRPDGKPTPRYAHRISYELEHGPIPDDQLVLHINDCNTPPCVRPSHLYLGSPQKNMDDRDEINHTSRGEHRYNAKLTEDDVRAIRRDYGKRGIGGLSSPKLAARHNIDVALVHRIIHRKSWAHVI